MWKHGVLTLTFLLAMSASLCDAADPLSGVEDGRSSIRQARVDSVLWCNWPTLYDEFVYTDWTIDGVADARRHGGAWPGYNFDHYSPETGESFGLYQFRGLNGIALADGGTELLMADDGLNSLAPAIWTSKIEEAETPPNWPSGSSATGGQHACASMHAIGYEMACVQRGKYCKAARAPRTYGIVPDLTRSSLEESFPTRVEQAGGQFYDVDVRVTLLWDNCNDMDVAVRDPNGFLVYYGARESPEGGVLDIDENSSGCQNSEPVENIRWSNGTAPDGTYTVEVRHYAYHTERAAYEWSLQVQIKGERPVFYTGSFGDNESVNSLHPTAVTFTFSSSSANNGPANETSTLGDLLCGSNGTGFYFRDPQFLAAHATQPATIFVTGYNRLWMVRDVQLSGLHTKRWDGGLWDADIATTHNGACWSPNMRNNQYSRDLV